MTAPRSIPAAQLSEREDQWITWVIDRAHQSGWGVAHFRPAKTAHGWRTPVQADGKGFPDLVLVRDRVIFAELKAAKGKLAREQQWWEVILRAAGAEFYVWRPADRPDITRILR